MKTSYKIALLVISVSILLILQIFVLFHPISVEAKRFLSSFFTYTTVSILVYGIIFEVALIAILVKIGRATASSLRQFRSNAIIIIFIVSALITPPDLFSQLVYAIPLVLLYEISIFIVRINEHKRKEENGENYAG